MQPTETRSGLPAWSSCESHYISWFDSVSGFRRPSTNGIPGTTHLGIENPETASYSMPPACSSLCTISASRVQLLFWPTPYASSGPNLTITSAPTPRISVGPDGYTFSSPSAYIIYSGLSAFALNGNVGGTYDNVTHAYAPTALSTIYSCSWPFYQTSRIDFQDFNVPPRWSVISAHQGCDVCGQQYLYSDQQPGDALVTGYANMNFDQIPWLGQGHSSWTLQPSIAAPAGITDIDPAWKHCTSLYQGIWDPPRTLTPVAGMTPTATPDPNADPGADPKVSPTPAPSAAPASAPKNPLPAPTSVPAQADPDTSNQATVPMPGQPWASTPKSKDPPQPAPVADQTHKKSPTHAPAPVQASGDTADPPNDPVESGSGSQEGSQLDPSHKSASNAEGSSKIKPSGQTPSGPLNEPGQGSGTKQPHGTNADPATPGASNPKVEATVAVGDSPSSGDASANADNVGPGPSPSLPYVYLSALQESGHRSDQPNSAANKEATSTHKPNPSYAPIVKPSIGIVAAGQTFTPLNAGTVVAQSMTLSIGGKAVTMQGSKLSMGSAGLEAGTSTISIPSPGSDPLHVAKDPAQAYTPAVFTAAGEEMTLVGHSQLLVNGATISKGSQVTTINGKDISFGTAGLVIGTSSIPLPSEPAISITPQPFTAAGEAITPIASDKLLINGMTLTANSPAVTISGGETASYGTSGLVIGSSTISLPGPITTGSPIQQQQQQFSAAGAIFTPLSDNSLILVDGETLTKGSAAKTVDGEVMSLGSSALVIGSSTVPLAGVETSTSTDSLGNIIMSGFGPSGGANASTTGVQAFTGTASNGLSVERRTLVIGLGCASMLYFWS